MMGLGREAECHLGGTPRWRVRKERSFAPDVPQTVRASVFAYSLSSRKAGLPTQQFRVDWSLAWSALAAFGVAASTTVWIG